MRMLETMVRRTRLSCSALSFLPYRALTRASRASASSARGLAGFSSSAPAAAGASSSGSAAQREANCRRLKDMGTSRGNATTFLRERTTESTEKKTNHRGTEKTTEQDRDQG